MAHTPGPWHVVPEAQSPWIVGDAEGDSIADCEPPGPWMSEEEADANARLIAAAPDLLAALEACVDAMTDGGKCEIKKWLDAFDLARLAIAKAKGQREARK
jgi:hypothetical protein